MNQITKISYAWLTLHDFDEILGLIQDDITKTNTNMWFDTSKHKICCNDIVFVHKCICPEI